MDIEAPSETEAELPPHTSGMASAIDRFVYGVEKGLVTGSLWVMTFTYFFMIVHRQMSNRINAFDELFLRFYGYEDEAKAPKEVLEFVTGVLTPVVVGTVAFLLIILALRTRWRTYEENEGAKEPWLTWLWQGFFWLQIVYFALWVIGAASSWALCLVALQGAIVVGIRFGRGTRDWGMITGVMVGAISMTLFFMTEVEDGYTWASHFSLILLFYVGFLGASMATRDGKQISVDAVRKKIPGSKLYLYNAISGLVTLGFTAFLLFLALYNFILPLEEFIAYLAGASESGYGHYLEGTELPIFVIIFPIALAFLMMCVRFGGRTLHALGAHRRGEIPPDTGPELH
jgi:TRAP-type C4-dicarboxylate transport system permease small subunit